MSDLLSDPPRRIAVFRALQLGDMLCAVPALRALRTAWPTAHITLVGLPWAQDFVDRFDYVDELLEFPGFPGLPEREPALGQLAAFFAEAQARHFDLAIQLHGSGTLTNPLVAALGARRNAGFVAAGGWCPDPHTFLPWPAAVPEVRRLLSLVAFLGAPPCGEHLELPLLPEERRAFTVLRQRLPIGEHGYICVHPGARLASRRWLPERFAHVADRLADTGLTVILTGTAAEAPLLAAVEDHMRAPAVNLAGRTTLGTLAALVEGARLVVCNDTGMSHVAAAMRTPSVVVACGSDPRRWRPLDGARHRVVWRPVRCRPCAHEHCPTGHECAVGVEAQAVFAHAASLLQGEQETAHAG